MIIYNIQRQPPGCTQRPAVLKLEPQGGGSLFPHSLEPVCFLPLEKKKNKKKTLIKAEVLPGALELWGDSKGFYFS